MLEQRALLVLPAVLPFEQCPSMLPLVGVASCCQLLLEQGRLVLICAIIGKDDPFGA